MLLSSLSKVAAFNHSYLIETKVVTGPTERERCVCASTFFSSCSEQVCYQAVLVEAETAPEVEQLVEAHANANVLQVQSNINLISRTSSS